MKERLFDLLRQLVAINSVNPTLAGGPGERNIAEFIAEELRESGLTPHLQRVGSDRYNVVSTVAGVGEAPPLLLNAHIDTVGTEGMDAPFMLRRDGDRLYGRGSYDMKGSVAIMLTLAERWAADPPAGDVLLTFVADEEDHSVGMEHLVAEWLPALPKPPAGAIVLEPTDERIGVAHKGFAWLRVTVTGRAAHGSRPSEGVDAIMPLAAALVELGEIQDALYDAEPDPLLGYASLHASIAEGGTAWSVYPAEATLKWERRTLPAETSETLKRELQQVVEAVRAYPGEHTVAGTLVFERLPHRVSRQSHPVQVLQTTVSEVEIAGLPFWTDAALLGAAGVPSVLYGPIGHGPHAIDEWVSLESLVRVCDVLQRILAV